MEECIKVKLIDEFGKLTPHFKEKFGHERLVSLKSIKGRYKRDEVEYFLILLLKEMHLCSYLF